jgi:primase-polymerase (primpol)-like protein
VTDHSPPTGESIPRPLLEYNQWICWREARRDGKQTKIPIEPATGEYASTTDPETWSSFRTAREWAETENENGLGFVFTTDDSIVGVDLDDCRDPETGAPEEWAKSVIERLESYTEVSPSGTGYHVLVSGSLPDGRNRKGDLEVYEATRFFTVTGAHVDGTPTTVQERADELQAVYADYLAPDEGSNDDIESTAGQVTHSLADDELLEKAKNAKNGEKFGRLWRGSTAGYESHSEADMALCSLLAFWTGGDERQVDQLFRDSGLMREKWDEVHYADGSTYGEKTIERAVAGTTEFYEPSGTQSTAPASETQPTADLEEVQSREAERTARIAELQERLDEVLDEKAKLKVELEEERARRQELEAKLERKSESDDSLFGWF